MIITMRDIAQKAGVSTATVSRVLNKNPTSIPISKHTREKVEQIASEMGYSPNVFAKTLRTKKSMLIGVVVWDLTDLFFSEILRGIDNTLHLSGYKMLLNSAEGSSEREFFCMEKMRDLHVDGMIILGGDKSSSTQNLIALNIDPSTSVLVGTTADISGKSVSSITVDNFTGGYIGLQYLGSKQKKQIYYLAGKNKTTDMIDRLEGVIKAVKDLGLEDHFEKIDIGPGEQAGYQATKQLIETTEVPAAIFAVSDLTALGAIRAIKESSYTVPEDIAVLGFDDLALSSYLHPSLSTIRQPRYDMGVMASVMLLDAFASKKNHTGDEKDTNEHWNYPTKQRRLKPRLIVREST